MGYKHDIQDIISKGSRLIRKKGYHNVGINEILAACEIPKGSFYNFFKSKEEFAARVLDSYGEGSLNYINSFMLRPEISPLQRLKNFYAGLIQGNVEDGLDAGCLVNNMSNEIGGTNPTLAKIADNNFRIWLEAISKTVAEGQEKGEIVNTMAAYDLAEYLHAGFAGGFGRMKVTKDRAYLDKWYTMTFNFISV